MVWHPTCSDGVDDCDGSGSLGPTRKRETGVEPTLGKARNAKRILLLKVVGRCFDFLR